MDYQRKKRKGDTEYLILVVEVLRKNLHLTDQERIRTLSDFIEDCLKNTKIKTNPNVLPNLESRSRLKFTFIRQKNLNSDLEELLTWLDDYDFNFTEDQSNSLRSALEHAKNEVQTTPLSIPHIIYLKKALKFPKAG